MESLAWTEFWISLRAWRVLAYVGYSKGSISLLWDCGAIWLQHGP
ncbi:hypothetical protein T12_6193 [Trichinella patagoniensis]|uniref:Uncharacterized protein n=1 Tax=Trichinella patagoniensis TaxID=990121 RepID=A0A0V0W6S7_9BILA|nr:hypothetical protein T12_6193 [Trichinella patagoniensis]